mmetsp:Transcript_11301/g.11185  ORF Transcript_11301/g.11185 Transcript_11301/m.11185 type:complete len:116 (-) Transcript_11301:184-531(-)
MNQTSRNQRALLHSSMSPGVITHSHPRSNEHVRDPLLEGFSSTRQSVIPAAMQFSEDLHGVKLGEHLVTGPGKSSSTPQHCGTIITQDEESVDQAFKASFARGRAVRMAPVAPQQ